MSQQKYGKVLFAAMRPRSKNFEIDTPNNKTDNRQMTKKMDRQKNKNQKERQTNYNQKDRKQTKNITVGKQAHYKTDGQTDKWQNRETNGKYRYTKRNITKKKDKLIKTDQQTEKTYIAKKPTNKLDKQQKQMDRQTATLLHKRPVGNPFEVMHCMLLHFGN